MKYRIIFILISIFWMLLIFSMSAQNGEESGGLSEKVCRVICKVVIKDYDDLPEYVQQEYIVKIHYPVRKLAHMTEFGILGLLYSAILFTYNFVKGKNYVIAVLLTFIYAITDECHQLFVGGRGASIVDVAIDTLGALIMVGVLHLIIRLVIKNKTSCIN